jgi:ribonuclease HII
MSPRRTKLTLGIDEAGRGPVLGQMVLAAVVLDSKSARCLSKAGLADSKSYGSGKKAKQTRSDLAAAVREHALFVSIEVVPAGDIDKRVRRSELNLLEREVADRLIRSAPEVDRIVADGERLFKPLQSKYAHLEAHNNGESKHAAVAAASVIAKTRRDELFALMQARYAPRFGSFEGGGYVNKTTQGFLREYAKAHGCLPPEARRSWPFAYLRDILGDSWQPCESEAESDVPDPQLTLF